MRIFRQRVGESFRELLVVGVGKRLDVQLGEWIHVGEQHGLERQLHFVFRELRERLDIVIGHELHIELRLVGEQRLQQRLLR
jgi:hypothetical protein